MNVLEEDSLEENHQNELIVSKDFEFERKQHLKEQQFTNIMGSSRNIRFSKSNKETVNMALTRWSKDLKINYKNFGSEC